MTTFRNTPDAPQTTATPARQETSNDLTRPLGVTVNAIQWGVERPNRATRRAQQRAQRRAADRIDGYDRDDLGESPDY